MKHTSGGSVEIRWDTDRMRQLAATLEDRGQSLLDHRMTVIAATGRVGRRSPELRALVVASSWARLQAQSLLERRRLLGDAERQLLWQLAAPLSSADWRPVLRSRPIEAIQNDIDAALELAAWESNHPNTVTAARTELRVAELTLELAMARRNRALLGRRPPDPAQSAALAEVIDFLSYNVARARPVRPVDVRLVEDALAAVRDRLDESWFADVGRADLLAVGALLTDLERPELDAVLGRLEDDELYRWFHELDGVRGGNLDIAEEESLFAALAAAAGAASLFRLALAEGGSRFAEISSAVRRSARPEVAMEFIEMCAAHAAASDDALVAALAGMAQLGVAERIAVAHSLHTRGLLDQLTDAALDFVQRMAVTRDRNLVLEFLEGIGSALRSTAGSLADLSVVGLVDRHRFREAWSSIGGVATLAFTDPLDFAAALINLELLRRNPARWTGEVAADLSTAGLTRVARLGRLGKVAQSIAHWLRRLNETVVVDAARIRLRAGHVRTALEQLASAADAASMIRALRDLETVQSSPYARPIVAGEGD